MKKQVEKKIQKKAKKITAIELGLELALKAGELLLKKQKKISLLKITHKDAQGVATNADVESEQLIIKGIKKYYPDHLVLAEELAYKEFHGEKARYEFLKEKEWVWIIDPLDGTNNFLSGMDYYAVCIALVHWGMPVVGIVYRPANGDCFIAEKNKGTRFFNFKLKTKKQLIKKNKNAKTLETSLLVTGFTSEKGELFDQEFELFKKMVGKSRGIRRMGSAALDLCYVAQGIFDCFWERGLAPWDVAAAGLICLEAGVQVTDYDGRKFNPFQETILAARAPLNREILSLFRKGL
jgi:myo-inositol-1(or 4)-monophosphatase